METITCPNDNCGREVEVVDGVIKKHYHDDKKTSSLKRYCDMSETVSDDPKVLLAMKLSVNKPDEGCFGIK